MFRQPKSSSGMSGSAARGKVLSAAASAAAAARAQQAAHGGSGSGTGSGAGDKCRYPHRVCAQPPIDNYDYCIKHILEDKNAPFKPCGYTYAVNNKRCLQPAPRGDKKDIGYCAMHLWKTQVKRQKSTAKLVPPVSTEALLATLSHYVRPIKTAKNSLTGGGGGAGGGGGGGSGGVVAAGGVAVLDVGSEHAMANAPTRAINPFVEADVGNVALSRTDLLECASESESDVEPSNLETVWSAANEDTSDAESVDSQVDDPLRHAGVFTADEVVRITGDKLFRLQKLYRHQFERLAHVLREKRRTYLHALKKEKETLSTIYDQSRTSVKEQRLYEKLKALNRYQKRSNSETVAHYASIEKRARESGATNYRPSGHNAKCTFTEGGVRCSRITLPLTKFCFKHILDDPNQSIFRACGCEKADSTVCQEAIINSLCSSETCVLHVKLPLLPHLNLPADSPSKDDAGKRIAGSSGGGDNESELDASATESAFSTDNRESPESPIMSEKRSRLLLLRDRPVSDSLMINNDDDDDDDDVDEDDDDDDEDGRRRYDDITMKEERIADDGGGVVADLSAHERIKLEPPPS